MRITLGVLGLTHFSPRTCVDHLDRSPFVRVGDFPKSEQVGGSVHLDLSQGFLARASGIG